MQQFTYLRFLAVALALGIGAVISSAQTQAGAIKAVQLVGSVSVKSADGKSRQITEGQALIESDVVSTGTNSSVVLVFMNGSSVKLEETSRLAIEEFKMDPLADDIAVAQLTAEPTLSKTRLSLAFGEMVGNVKKLNSNSLYDIKTPAGAAGIRGTTFRIVLRFDATGQIEFQLSTAEGLVVFTGIIPTVGTGTATETSGEGVAVAGGQEVTATVQINPTTNVVSSSVISTPQPISAAATQAINTAITQAIQQAAQTTTFTPAEQQSTATSTSGTTTGSSTTKPQPEAEQTPEPSSTSTKPSTSSPTTTSPSTALDTTTRSG
ncbi:MAG: FecR domain-containing protein [Candidatus Didemnitutus sp.]|nr:FecR domain-containing protein [Candidatus Didemnitutus sp.]